MDPQQLAAELRALADRIDPPAEPRAGFRPGDLAQLRPDADPVWGGMLLHVCQCTRYEVRGYLLTPHRGGCREAWARLRPPALLPVGRAVYQQPEWGLRRWCQRDGCPTDDRPAALPPPARKFPAPALDRRRSRSA